MKTLERLFAEKLLKIKAIKLQPANPFTWASGWKSPFYCDNRKTLSYPSLRNFVKIEITRLILERFGQVDAIAGVATGAIPQGALVADALNLPFVYVRSTPKDHGLENLIEGELRPGMKVVVVEDLISTGGSSLKAVEAIRRDGCEVIGMVAAYTYGFSGTSGCGRWSEGHSRESNLRWSDDGICHVWIRRSDHKDIILPVMYVTG